MFVVWKWSEELLVGETLFYVAGAGSELRASDSCLLVW